MALEFARTSKYCELKWEGVECSPNSGIPKNPTSSLSMPGAAQASQCPAVTRTTMDLLLQPQRNQRHLRPSLTGLRSARGTQLLASSSSHGKSNLRFRRCCFATTLNLLEAHWVVRVHRQSFRSIARLICFSENPTSETSLKLQADKVPATNITSTAVKRYMKKRFRTSSSITLLSPNV